MLISHIPANHQTEYFEYHGESNDVGGDGGGDNDKQIQEYLSAQIHFNLH